jgi:uncharacterized repeat protein (TIGR03806 family)
MNRKSQATSRGMALGVVAAIVVAAIASCRTEPTRTLQRVDWQPSRGTPLNMPDDPHGEMPKLLSQTGAFKETRGLIPNKRLVPYDLNVPFWSDGAEKSRWMAPPYHNGALPQKIRFAATGEWTFPSGTIFVKNFELATNELLPNQRRRLETRLLVRTSAGGVYGVTYKWRPDNSDADLLTTNLSEPITITTARGPRTQVWYYPSREDCLTCHTTNAGLVLGVKTRQLNRPFVYPSGMTNNELREWNHLGLFNTNLDATDFSMFPKLARADDHSRSLEDRARSYLDANCAHCHRPRGTVAYFDARYDTPLAAQNLINGNVLIDERIDNPRIVAPNDTWRSILYLRASSSEAFKMPPLAHNEPDVKNITLLREWIESLPGQPVLPPPDIFPSAGNFEKPVTVSLKSEPGATIRYTLDGTVPTQKDLLYEKPFTLTSPTIVRAKAFKRGYTKSITSQQIYIVKE